MRVASVLALTVVATIFACTFGALVVGAWLVDAVPRRRGTGAAPAPAPLALGHGWMLCRAPAR